jgi:hypothetical protein
MAVSEERDAQAVWLPIEGIIESEVSDEMVLFHPGEMSYYGLNPTGAAVWKRLDGTRPVGHIIDELALENQADKEEVESDVFDFLGELRQLGFFSPR